MPPTKFLAPGAVPGAFSARAGARIIRAGLRMRLLRGRRVVLPRARATLCTAAVSATLHYTGPLPDDRAAQHGEYVGFAAPVADETPRLLDVRVPRDVHVRDARTRRFALATDGFELRRWPTRVEDFEDTASVLQRYVPEVRALVARAVGASVDARVVVWDLCLRSSALRNELQEAASSAAAADSLALDLLAPVPLVHVDFHSARDVYARVRQRCERRTDTLSSCMGADFAAAGLSRAAVERHVADGRRVASVNVWRSTASRPVRRDPLALCEPRSVRAAERVPFTLACPDVSFAEAHVLAGGSERHRWWHYPEMVRDECVLFVSGDSAGRWPSVPHTSFAHPATAADDPPRTSIEARVFVLFEE